MWRSAGIFVVWFLCAIALWAEPIDQGPVLTVRLLDSVSTAGSETGQVISAVVIPSVLEVQSIPAGSRITGIVAERKRPDARDVERARLRILFDRLILPSGTSVTIEGRILEVENAREQVDEEGSIVGILASESLSARLDRSLGSISGRYPGLGGILAGLRAGIFGAPNSEIQYGPGVELRVGLLHQPTLGAQDTSQEFLLPASQALVAYVNALPYRTESVSPRGPSDLVQLVFLSKSEQELRKAFQAAGWTEARGQDAVANLETLQAVMEMRGFNEAPVSTLLLAGRSPDLVFQKQNNTFAKRHHIRIWHGESFEGRGVWLGAATHDVEIEFSEQTRTFVHRIDTQIDRERAKVLDDLAATGLIQGFTPVDLAPLPPELRNATGDALITDGRAFVIWF